MHGNEVALHNGTPAVLDPASTRRASPPHIVRLDGVRGLAVLAVLLQHSFNIGKEIPIGYIGVQLFFVLSGFLITGILLRSRKRARHEGSTIGQELKTFYARRALRIFPLFYLVLILLVVFNVPHMRERFIWDALYLNNVYFPLTHSTGGGLDAHLWSLAVEEHFYLVWPLLLILASDSAVIPIVIAPIILCAVFRVIACAAGGDFPIVMNMTPTAMDSLGFGALLAVITTPEFLRPRTLAVLQRLGIWLGVPAIIGFLVFAHRQNMWLFVAFGFFTPLFCFWLVNFGRHAGSSSLSRLLAWRFLALTGVISYGLYMYHIYINFLIIYLIPNSVPHAWHRYIRALMTLPISFAVALVSYYFFERPIMNLKKRFNY